MRILITGASGFVGSAICRALVGSGHTVLGLTRGSPIPVPGVMAVAGDMSRPHEFLSLLDQARPDAIIHAAAIVSRGVPDVDASMRINVDATRALARAARETGVARWIQISSMSAHPANKSVYGGSKFAADHAVREEAPPWTIVRPSLVYGSDQRGIFFRLAQMVSVWPAIPLPGGGGDPVQPIHGDDLADLVLRALADSAPRNRTVMAGGATPYTFRGLVAAMADMLGRRPALLPVPLPLCRFLSAGAQALLTDPPLTLDNLEGLARAQLCDNRLAIEQYDWHPRPFETGFLQCLQEGLLASSDRSQAADLEN